MKSINLIPPSSERSDLRLPSGDHSITIHSDGSLTVGCQFIPRGFVEKLASLSQEAAEKNTGPSVINIQEVLKNEGVYRSAENPSIRFLTVHVGEFKQVLFIGRYAIEPLLPNTLECSKAKYYRTDETVSLLFLKPGEIPLKISNTEADTLLEKVSQWRKRGYWCDEMNDIYNTLETLFRRNST